MSACETIRGQFSDYLDGLMTGKAMQRVAAHLESCSACAEEFTAWRRTQSLLASLGPAKAPADLALRLRVALSQEQARVPWWKFPQMQIFWENSIAPFLLQASAGLASTILLMGTVGLLIGMFATPEPVEARDEPIGMASAPRYLYSADELGNAVIGQRDNPVVVEAYVSGDGRVYDFQIVSGPSDAATHAEVENLLLFSVFEPARVFGQPVRGTAVLSFAGVNVQG